MAKDRCLVQHDVLMKKWMAKHDAEENGFAEDGIVSPDVWFSLPAEEERIMFLLKEAYAKEDTKSKKKLIWSETKWLAHEPCMDGCKKRCKTCTITGTTFNAVAEWVYGIKNVRSGNQEEYDNWLGVRSRNMKEYRAARDDLLSRIAVVNVKKSSGVKSSDMKDIMSYAECDKDYLKEQIELIKPTVIVCGGTYEMLRHIYPELEEMKRSSNGATMLGDMKVIASCHPNAHIKNEAKYRAVVENYISLL